jgi:hypothetical protein
MILNPNEEPELPSMYEVSPEKAGPILCAAVHWTKGKSITGNALNIPHGTVLMGRRHFNVIEVMEELKSTGHFPWDTYYGHTVDGFITKNWYFVTRKVGMQIALHFNQLLKPSNNDLLYTEDLY